MEAKRNRKLGCESCARNLRDLGCTMLIACSQHMSIGDGMAAWAGAAAFIGFCWMIGKAL